MMDEKAKKEPDTTVVGDGILPGNMAVYKLVQEKGITNSVEVELSPAQGVEYDWNLKFKMNPQTGDLTPGPISGKMDLTREFLASGAVSRLPTPHNKLIMKFVLDSGADIREPWDSRRSGFKVKSLDTENGTEFPGDAQFAPVDLAQDPKKAKLVTTGLRSVTKFLDPVSDDLKIEAIPPTERPPEKLIKAITSVGRKLELFAKVKDLVPAGR